jgi:hypothetical protein
VCFDLNHFLLYNLTNNYNDTVQLNETSTSVATAAVASTAFAQIIQKNQSKQKIIKIEDTKAYKQSACGFDGIQIALYRSFGIDDQAT